MPPKHADARHTPTVSMAVGHGGTEPQLTPSGAVTLLSAVVAFPQVVGRQPLEGRRAVDNGRGIVHFPSHGSAVERRSPTAAPK